MSEQMKTLYVKACKFRSESDIQKDKEFKEAMMEKVRNAKKASYNKFLDELQELPAAAAIEETSKMAKALTRRTKQNEMAGPHVQNSSLLGVHLQHMHLKNRVER